MPRLHSAPQADSLAVRSAKQGGLCLVQSDAATYAAARATYAATYAAANAARATYAAGAGGAAYAAGAAADAYAWDEYFKVLDTVLNAGPQGEPWSADVVAQGVRLFEEAAR